MRGTVSPTARTHGSGIVQVREAPLTIASNNQLTKGPIPISATGICWFGDLSPQGRNGSPGVRNHGFTESEHEITTWTV